jgi:hypothetical protein
MQLKLRKSLAYPPAHLSSRFALPRFRIQIRAECFTYDDIAKSYVKFIIELDHGFSSPDHEDQLDRVKPAL